MSLDAVRYGHSIKVCHVSPGTTPTFQLLEVREGSACGVRPLPAGHRSEVGTILYELFVSVPGRYG